MAKKEKKQKTQENPKAEQKSKEDTKGKKDSKNNKKSKKGSSGAINNLPLDRSKMTAEQLTQAQIEEAIRESQDPSLRLKKIKNPLSFKSCLLNIIILVVLTVAIVLLVCWIKLDKETFNLWVVIKDIFKQFGITDFFSLIGRKLKGIFG